MNVSARRPPKQRRKLFVIIIAVFVVLALILLNSIGRLLISDRRSKSEAVKSEKVIDPYPTNDAPVVELKHFERSNLSTPLTISHCPTLPRHFRAPMITAPALVCGGHGQCIPSPQSDLLSICSCDDGWEGYACDIHLRQLIGEAAYTSYKSRKSLDAIYPKEQGPSPADGNQYVDDTSVGLLVRPILVLPVLSASVGEPSEATASNKAAVGRLLNLLQSFELSINGGAATFANITLVVSSEGASTSASPVCQGISALTMVHSDLVPFAHLTNICVLDTTFLNILSSGQQIFDRQHTAILEGMNQGMALQTLAPFLLPINLLTVTGLHEHTNVRLAVSQLLTTDVDLLGFQSLYPMPTDTSASEQFLFVSECWDIVIGRWALQRKKAPFGYRRHDRYSMLCESSSADLSATLIREASNLRFDPAMGSMGMMDLYVQVKYSINPAARADCQKIEECSITTRRTNHLLVGTCAECLLKRTPIAYESFVKMSHTNTAFASKYNVEVVKGSSSGGALLYNPFDGSLQAVSTEEVTNQLDSIRRHFLRSNSMLAKADSSIISASLDHLTVLKRASGGKSYHPILAYEKRASLTQRVACAKSGGIYGPSKAGQFSPFCHRWQRKRDFLLMHLLWTTPHFFQRSPPASPKRYAISVHAGNLFGALRFGKELFWETDGDFDLIALDDTHDELVARFERFLKFLSGKGQPDEIDFPFTIKPSEDGKPWYASILRDKVDFQLNARSALDPKTRGKPPHIFNISVIYEGVPVFMNGFQNPWLGVRSAPGHDYRRLYLAFQKWTPNRQHTKSLECAKTGGTINSSSICLPPCNLPRYQLDHSYCDILPPDLQEELSLLDEGLELV